MQTLAKVLIFALINLLISAYFIQLGYNNSIAEMFHLAPIGMKEGLFLALLSGSLLGVGGASVSPRS